MSPFGYIGPVSHGDLVERLGLVKTGLSQSLTAESVNIGACSSCPVRGNSMLQQGLLHMEYLWALYFKFSLCISIVDGTMLHKDIFIQVYMF